MMDLRFVEGSKKNTPNRLPGRTLNLLSELIILDMTDPFFCQLLGIYIHPKKSSKGIQPCIFTTLPAHFFFFESHLHHFQSPNLYRLQSLENWTDTPPKINMEPENGPLKQEIPIGKHHFQVLCQVSGGVPDIIHLQFPTYLEMDSFIKPSPPNEWRTSKVLAT